MQAKWCTKPDQRVIHFSFMPSFPVFSKMVQYIYYLENNKQRHVIRCCISNMESLFSADYFNITLHVLLYVWFLWIILVEEIIVLLVFCSVRSQTCLAKITNMTCLLHINKECPCSHIQTKKVHVWTTLSDVSNE